MSKGFGSYKFLRIPYYERYIMDKKGNVYLLDDSADNVDNYILTPVIPEKHKGCTFLILNDERVLLRKMYSNTWYGVNSFEVTELDTFGNIRFQLPTDFVHNMELLVHEFEYNKTRYILKCIDNLNYYVSEYGCVISVYLKKPLKFGSANCMHPKLKLGYCNLYIHRLVYELYVGNIGEADEIDHLISTARNHFSELDKVDGFENKRRYREKSSILTEDDVHFICSLMEKNIDGHAIFDSPQLVGKFKSYSNFSDLCTHIKSRKSWSDISTKYDVSKYDPKSHSPNSKLSKNDVVYIYTNPDILESTTLASKFNVSVNTIYRIKSKTFFKHYLDEI